MQENVTNLFYWWNGWNGWSWKGFRACRMQQRIEEQNLWDYSSKGGGQNVRSLVLQKLTYDKILDVLVFDLIRSLQDYYDDSKKRKLDGHRIVTDEKLALSTLQSLESITKDNEYTPESLSFQASLEPLLCCLNSSNYEIRRITINILEYLLKEPDNRLIIESQGFLPYLFAELGSADDFLENKARYLQLARIICSLPTEPQNFHGVICDLCGKYSYSGISYKCLVCDDWDYCAVCYCLSRHSRNHIQIKMQQRNYGPFATLARNIVTRTDKLTVNEESKTHYEYDCAGCGLNPIHGARYFCLNCQSNLCQKCESKHNRMHVFLKFRYPFKDLASLSESDAELLLKPNLVIPSEALRQPQFLPTIEKTIPLEINPFSEGKWLLYTFSAENRYELLPPSLVEITQPDPSSSSKDWIHFVMTNNKVEMKGQMSATHIFFGKSVGEREGDGFRGFMKGSPKGVFKLRKLKDGEEAPTITTTQTRNTGTAVPTAVGIHWRFSSSDDDSD